MFGIGPPYLFFVRHRVPLVGLMRGGLWSWISTMLTNGIHRRLGLLHSAPNRGYLLGRGTGLEPAERSASRQLSLRAAENFPPVHSQHRCASGAPPLRSNPFLSAPARAARTSGAEGVGRVTLLQSLACAAGVVGRKTPAFDFVLWAPSIERLRLRAATGLGSGNAFVVILLRIDPIRSSSFARNSTGA